MKKSMIILGLSGMAALSGCSGANEASDRDIYEESGNTINVNDNRAELYNENGEKRNKSKDFGYVRHQKSPNMGKNVANNNHYSAIDREQLANIISKLSTDLPDVNDVATLVTDEEVLIAYDSNTKDRSLTAEQVKRTALSVVPGYFHVYVTDNKNLIKNVESYAFIDSDTPNVEFMMDKLIKQMKASSPQGEENRSSENEKDKTTEDMHKGL